MTTQIASQPVGSHLFRRVLRSNAVFTAVSGAVLVLGAGPLAALFGLDAPIVFVVIGVGLLLGAAWLFRATAREPISRSFVLLVALLDTAWVLISAIGLLANWFPVTTEGKWIILFVADAVGILAALEFYALWRTRESRSG
ncbi:MAG: hypothetical protein ACRENW_01090 [Thermodesulfobacteriota bacterium]